MATLARFERDFTDDAGNLLTGNVTVAVVREGAGPVAVYSDRDGAVSLGSTWAQDGGAVAFHAAGGAYRITVTQGAFSRSLRYVAIGTNAERDFDTVALNGVMQLVYNDEADSTEHASSTAESAALKSYSLAANDFDYIKIEAVVQSRLEQDAQTRADFTWRLKSAGATVTGGTFTQRLIADPTAGTDSGERMVTTISAIIAGGQAVSTALSITAQMTVSNAATGAVVKKFRVYGVKNVVLVRPTI